METYLRLLVVVYITHEKLQWTSLLNNVKKTFEKKINRQLKTETSYKYLHNYYFDKHQIANYGNITRICFIPEDQRN